jgi:hypothetical protein
LHLNIIEGVGGWVSESGLVWVRVDVGEGECEWGEDESEWGEDESECVGEDIEKRFSPSPSPSPHFHHPHPHSHSRPRSSSPSHSPTLTITHHSPSPSSIELNRLHEKLRKYKSEMSHVFQAKLDLVNSQMETAKYQILNEEQ